MMNQQPFESLEVLSIRRYNLLKALAQYEAGLSIKRLASILERDYKNVHDDVAKAGRHWPYRQKSTPAKIYTPYRQFTSSTSLIN